MRTKRLRATDHNLRCNECLKIGPQPVHRSWDADTVFRAQIIGFAVLNKLVRPPDANYGSIEARAIDRFEYHAAKSTGQHMIFKREDDVGLPCVEFNHLCVDWLGEARIDHRCR